MKYGLLLVAVGVGLAGSACGSSKKDSEQPQGYYQQPQPGYQQPPPGYQQQPQPGYQQPQPAPAPTPAATTPAPATSGSAATPTAIPGVMKNPDGTCSIQIPGGQPMAGPCPPGI